jgi:transposase
VYGLKHQKEKRSMDYFAGLDVSVKETSVCVVDDTGKIVREVKVASEPEALLAVLASPAYHTQTDWIGSGAIVAMAVQRARRSGIANDLR